MILKVYNQAKGKNQGNNECTVETLFSKYTNMDAKCQQNGGGDP